MVWILFREEKNDFVGVKMLTLKIRLKIIMFSGRNQIKTTPKKKEYILFDPVYIKFWKIQINL